MRLRVNNVYLLVLPTASSSSPLRLLKADTREVLGSFLPHEDVGGVVRVLGADVLDRWNESFHQRLSLFNHLFSSVFMYNLWLFMVYLLRLLHRLRYNNLVRLQI